MLNNLLIELGIDISASIILVGIKKLFSQKNNVSASDIKKEISILTKNTNEEKIEKIFNSLINEGVIMNNSNMVNGSNNIIIGGGNDYNVNEGGNINIGSDNTVNGKNNIVIGHGNKIG